MVPEVFKLFKEISIFKNEIAAEMLMVLLQYLVVSLVKKNIFPYSNKYISNVQLIDPNLNRNNSIQISKCGAGSQKAAATECGVRNRFTTFVSITLYLFTCWSPPL